MPTHTTPGQRFTQLIQQLGLTKNAFAQSLGKTATVIQHIVDERNKPGYDLLNKVCEVYPNVASDWLVLGQGPMLRASSPHPLFAEAAAATPTGPASVAHGIDPIDLSEVPTAPRRRNGTLLQPADIAATLVLAAQGNGNGKNGHGPAPSSAPAAEQLVQPEQPAAAPHTSPPALAAPVPGPLASPATGAAPALTPAPEPAYLAALLQAQHLQHQLALAEQRNQHLLEQQALLRQLVGVLQKGSSN